MYKSEYQGVLFVEGHPPGLQVLGHVEVNLHGVFSQAQLKSLDDVKKELIKKINALSGNCLINFKYGQKSSFWSTLIGIDNVGWYGSGDAAIMRESEQTS